MALLLSGALKNPRFLGLFDVNDVILHKKQSQNGQSRLFPGRGIAPRNFARQALRGAAADISFKAFRPLPMEFPTL